MKIFGMKFVGVAAAVLLGGGMTGQTARLLAQTAAVHGKVTNPAGLPLTPGDIKFTTDKNPNSASRKFESSFPIDANGNYKGDGVKPGNYLAIVYQGSKTLDFQQVTIAAGEDKTLDFDMTRKEYIDKMTPEDRAELEKYKKEHAAAVASNSKIENLNLLLKQAREDTKAGNFAPAIKSMTDATQAKPDEAVLWDTLGDAQLGDAVAADKAAKAAKATDTGVPAKYAGAIASYQKAITLNAALAKPDPKMTAAVDNQLGQAYGKTGKTKDSSDSYEAAAKSDPKNAGMYYFNEAATLFNAGDGDAAGAAADKAIAADPEKAEAYYIKGQSLISKATLDDKTKKYILPPGCLEAYQKYLELVPTGHQSDEVKAILESLGQPVKSSYKAGKK